jgi:hypothetical protein
MERKKVIRKLTKHLVFGISGIIVFWLLIFWIISCLVRG